MRPPRRSNEVAADRVLHVQRFGPPPWLFAAAQPRLGGRPLLTAMLTGEHHPPPRLHDVPEWPQVPALPGGIQRPVKLLLEAGAVGVGQGGADQLDPTPGGWGRWPAQPRSPRLLVVRTGLSAHQCDTGPMDVGRLPPEKSGFVCPVLVSEPISIARQRCHLLLFAAT
jgi:hypothetical protein